MLTIEEAAQSFSGKEQGGYAISQCEAAESSSQVNPQVIDGKERSPLDEVLRRT